MVLLLPWLLLLLLLLLSPRFWLLLVCLVFAGVFRLEPWLLSALLLPLLLLLLLLLLSRCLERLAV